MRKGNWEIYFEAVKKPDWPLARKVLKEIAVEEKDNPQVYLKLGDVCQRTGDTPGAIEAYHTSARLQLLRGFFQKAIALYKIILRLDPHNAKALSKTEKLVKELEGTKSPQYKPAAGPASGTVLPDFQMVGSMEQPVEESSLPGLFSGISREDYVRVREGLALKTYPEGSSVIEEDGSGDSMYIIRSGRARVVTHMLGREIELAVLTEGDLFGEIAFLSGRPRTASVIAEGPLEVYELGRADIEMIIEKKPEILSRLEDFYESRARATIKKVLPKRS